MPPEKEDALTDITPLKYRCGDMSPACPAILQGPHTLVIIGKTVDLNERPSLRNRVSEGETAIEISTDLIKDAVSSSLSK